MKRVLNFILTIMFLITLTACSGNFSQINLNEPIEISEEGMIEKGIWDKIKADNAIATFVGSDGDMRYEWTVFGSDLTETRDVNLLLDLEKTQEGVEIVFLEKEDLGFPALLSIYLNERWNADSATAYEEDTPLYSVSITGSKNSILNISVNTMVEKCIILPDEVSDAENTSSEKDKMVLDDNLNEKNQEDVQVSVQEDDYLLAVEEDNGQVYTGVSKDNIQGMTSAHKDDYLSDVKQESDRTYSAESSITQDKYQTDSTPEPDRTYSDGSSTIQDKYQTDPIPEGKPMPVEPEKQEINQQKTYTCTFSIECSTILNNLKDLDPDKRELVPSNGIILEAKKVTFYEGESVYDVLKRVCQENNIHMEASWTPVYNSAYVEGIHNLYEFDCGNLSGWMYRVNGWYPNYGCSRYQLADGETVEWRYTCDLGKDVGCDWMQ